MPPEPILSASVPRHKRHCCSFNSFRKISYCCWVVIPSLYHISPPFGSYLRMSPKVNTLVWEDCCRVFDAIELIRETIRIRLEQDVQNFLERTQGKQQVVQLTHEIANAEIELAKHPDGSYTYNLIAEDIHRKREQLKKYDEESKSALTNESLLDIYQQNVLSFLDFLSTM